MATQRFERPIDPNWNVKVGEPVRSTAEAMKSMGCTIIIPAYSLSRDRDIQQRLETDPYFAANRGWTRGFFDATQRGFIPTAERLLAPNPYGPPYAASRRSYLGTKGFVVDMTKPLY